jgi:hypothetical protein
LKSLRNESDKLAYWLTVLTGYYAAVAVKMLLWVHRNGGFANPVRHMGVLTLVTVRSATVHATILLALMFAVNLWRNSAVSSEPSREGLEEGRKNEWKSGLG